ncbi:MAG: hypothetical protein KGN32_05375 [Burkholderiales bacterium]|nr:hypothetical protein [Burkholderiales bacterium]
MSDRTDKVSILYLSRRNLEALLAKLNRRSNGEDTYCAIIKTQQASPVYKQTMREILVVAVDNDEYYLSQTRPAGEMHPLDEATLDAPLTGVRDCSTRL